LSSITLVSTSLVLFCCSVCTSASSLALVCSSCAARASAASLLSFSLSSSLVVACVVGAGSVQVGELAGGAARASSAAESDFRVDSADVRALHHQQSAKQPKREAAACRPSPRALGVRGHPGLRGRRGPHLEQGPQLALIRLCLPRLLCAALPQCPANLQRHRATRRDEAQHMAGLATKCGGKPVRVTVCKDL
jgi:hypothetical protein